MLTVSESFAPSQSTRRACTATRQDSATASAASTPVWGSSTAKMSLASRPTVAEVGTAAAMAGPTAPRYAAPAAGPWTSSRTRNRSRSR